MKMNEITRIAQKTVMGFWLAVVMVMSLTACSVNDNEISGVGEDYIDEALEKFNAEAIFHGKAYIAGTVDADLKAALALAIDDVNGTIDGEDTRIIVVNNLADLSDAQLQKAYNMGKSIAVAMPDSVEISNFVKAHDWIDFIHSNVSNNLLLFSFNRYNMFSHIVKPAYHLITAEGLETDDAEDADPVMTHLTAEETNYVYLLTWLRKLQTRYNEREHPTLTRADDSQDNKDTDLEKFGKYYHHSMTYPYDVDYNFRHVTWSKKDYLSGSGSLTVAYDIYTCHVYEGQPGAGDYYAVNMTTSVANEGMWKGKGDNRHGGVHVRWCGWYGTDFWVKSSLSEDAFAKYGWASGSFADNIEFTAQGKPSPSTTTGQTTYTKSHTFNISGSLTLGAQTGEQNGKPVALVNASAGVSAGWSWTKSETRNISDIDIQNTTEGNVASWKVIFNNLPKYSNSKITYDIGNSLAFRSTIDLVSSWLWYDPTGKDNDDKAPYKLVTMVGADYEMQSFITTGADNKKDNVSERYAEVIDLQKINNTTVGGIELNNNLADDTFITNVQVKDADDGTVYETYNNSITKGDKVLLGYFLTTKNYIVTFDAKKPADADYQHYSYTLNKQIPLQKTGVVTLNAASDFGVK